MRRILIVWELGGGYGHLDSFPDLALALRELGCEVSFVLRDLSRAGQLLGKHGFRYFQAPKSRYQQAGASRSTNYTEMLTRFGFLDPAGLLGVVSKWQQIYERLAPNLIIFNHSPTALLAASGTGIRRVLYGTGFECPPRVAPLPSVMPWTQVSGERLNESEGQVLPVINQVRDSLGAHPLGSVSDLFRVEGEILCTFSELDPYHEQRNIPEYWGPRIFLHKGIRPKWPTFSRKKRVFAYLRPGYRLFREVLQALATLPAHVLIHAPGLKSDTTAQLIGGHITFSTEPVDLAKASARCDLAISYASHATTAAMLLAGRPLCLLPMHVEQALTARAVSRLGAGLYVDLDDKEPDIKGRMETVLTDQAFTDGAKDFAGRYPDFNQNRQTSGIAQRIVRILSG